MKHHIFTQEERSELETNPHISKVMNSNVEYREEFKQRVFYEHEELGKTAKQIFAQAGIPDWLNKGKYAQKALSRWKYQQRHPNRNARGRPKINIISKPISEMSEEELRKEILDLSMQTAFIGLEETLKHKDCSKLMIHSDQGTHYTHPLYVNKLKELGVTQSMSRRGNCLDNAPIESFFGHLKDDLDIKSCKTFDEVKTLVENYIYYYNNERYQWNLNKMTPVQYRCHLLNAS